MTTTTKHSDKKALFIRELAEFLTCNQSTMSVRLEMSRPDAIAWAKLRSHTPLYGYPTADEAEKALTEFLR